VGRKERNGKGHPLSVRERATNPLHPGNVDGPNFPEMLNPPRLLSLPRLRLAASLRLPSPNAPIESNIERRLSLL
jgi:hypothetical protein